MKCPACGADNVSATGCRVCGAVPANPAPWPAGQAGQDPGRVDDGFGAGRRGTVAQAPRPRSSAGVYVGVARAVKLRTEPSKGKAPTLQVLNFRLDRFSDDGRPLPSIPVEMRRLHFHGSVNEGETVEVRGRWQPGDLLVVKRIQNISAGSPVIGKGRPHPLLKLLAIVLFLAVFVAIGALLIAFIFHKASGISGGNGLPLPSGTRHAWAVMAMAGGFHGDAPAASLAVVRHAGLRAASQS